MKNENTEAPSQLHPIRFLQTFIVQSLRVAELENSESNDFGNHITKVGLATSGCLEDLARQHLSLNGPIGTEEYARLIIDVKNHIGGRFEQAKGGQSTIRVVNHCCPFGDMVKEAPELCRMTSSVFGAIAARNFSYAKVELQKRIATNDGQCNVLVHLDPELAVGINGDEYRYENGHITAKTANSILTSRLEDKLCKAWSPQLEVDSPKPAKYRYIVAESNAMQAAIKAVEVVAPTSVSVLVTGETGVGKEVIARSVHATSKRADCVFLAVNCGAIPESLVESTLFGHEKGAFTDAYQAREGYFERTDGGTLFLDEIDCLPLATQARLLRVLQEGEYERVGGHQTCYTDTRIIAASNNRLDELVKKGKFRQDLYYRLNVVPIYIPPLRDRPDDINALVVHFLTRLAEKYNGKRKALSKRAWAFALSYGWPGNLRELENVLEQAYLFNSGDIIENIPVQDSERTEELHTNTLRDAKKQASMEVEVKVISDALARTQGNVSEAARQLGITPRAVHMKLRHHGINASAYRDFTR